MSDVSSLWTGLPDIALLEVFSCLATPQDRWNASLVCKHWSRFFGHPKIWEDVELNSDRSDDLTVASIRRFGAHFRRVKVYNSTFFFGVRDILREIAQRCEKVEVFILEPTYRTHEPIYLGIMAEFMVTFNKLHDLREVRLPFLQTTGTDSYNPLKSIGTNSAQTLSVLDVTEFTRYPRPLSTILKLKHIRSLGISYQNLTEDILLAMKEHRTLQDLTIVRSHAKPLCGSGTTLPGSIWQDLQYELPDLRVHLVLTEEAPLSCPKGIPAISYAVADHNNPNSVQLNRLVSKLILTYSETLQNFVIKADNSFYWDLQLAQLARRCSNMRVVIVDGTVTLEALVQACRQWDKLELLYVKQSKVTSNGESMDQVDREPLQQEELSKILGYPWQPLGDQEFFQKTKNFLSNTMTTAVLRRAPPKVYDKGYRY
ncbi:F-box/LRR-repeat protein 8-like isoform X1 [Branchiostoma floridae]|uniref:F-box/LRR-repeat protein 8-like isoform X1 n=1 Tax=Branchiostoma floridae TaxID=7739 RepID=A0A9J7KQJ7_BRAFL|nr:F-box/LRR-repeat protein 8-like isoform X1 [Branchiostoma floridae]